MATVNSSAASYASVGDFLRRYDARSIGDLVADDGLRVAASSLTGNVIIGSLLMQASGRLEAACTMGERYAPTDLAAMVASSTNMAEFLIGMVCSLTIELVYRRRPTPEMQEFPETAEADRMLNALAMGKMILGFTEAMTAGHIDSEMETTAIVEARKMPTTRAENLFGRRNNRIDAPISGPGSPP